MESQDEAEQSLRAPRRQDVVRLHQGLVVLAGALLVAAALALVFAIGDLGRARDAGVPAPDLLVWLARLVTGGVAWLVLCPVLLATPRLLGLPEGERETRWASGILWAAAVLGALFAVVEAVGFALSFLPDTRPFTEGRPPATEQVSMVGTALVGAATSALALGAVAKPTPDA